MSAFGRILDRYRPYVGRVLALEHVNVHFFGGFLTDLDNTGMHILFRL